MNRFELFLDILGPSHYRVVGSLNGRHTVSWVASWAAALDAAAACDVATVFAPKGEALMAFDCRRIAEAA